jgi:hypothetical protein
MTAGSTGETLRLEIAEVSLRQLALTGILWSKLVLRIVPDPRVAISTIVH